jgi:hypothetical protein
VYTLIASSTTDKTVYGVEQSAKKQQLTFMIGYVEEVN